MNKQELLEKWGEPQKVGTDGFVRLVDTMGNDSSIVQAARTSYGKGTKSVREDRGLIRYLMRHWHCYTPEMQVLTAEGWKRWDECAPLEKYAVPDPKTKQITFELLETESFDCDEDLYCFENNRMSYRVTSDHRMWFKSKYEDKHRIVRVQDMKKWGHFEPSSAYTYNKNNQPSQYARLEESETWGTKLDARFQFLGFYLGDGSRSSANRISFHLKKEHKKTYLRNLLNRLELEFKEKQSSTYEDTTIFWVDPSSDRIFFQFLTHWLGRHVMATAKEKGLAPGMLGYLDADCSKALLDGLINSDGSKKLDRPQIEFSSSSEDLVNVFERCASLVGGDAHRSKTQRDGVYRSTWYTGSRTTLEARKQYFYRETYTGKVYCTTTSTGLLIVRGGPDKFGFICGNTTPFEMCEVKFHVRVPMDIWRQWIRHRTASVNEYSTRYSEAIDSQNTTLPTEWRWQSTTNKQGSNGYVDDDDLSDILTKYESTALTAAKAAYKGLIDSGVAREQARKILPLSTYTEAYWKIDLHNLFHFLRLRLDSHAQQEIREFGEAIANMVSDWVPLAWGAFEDYRLNSCQFSAQEMSVLRAIVNGELGVWDVPDWAHTNEEDEGPVTLFELSPNDRVEFLTKHGLETKRERIEFWNKIKQAG